MHHAWIGGLIEHIVSLLGIADLAAGHYTEINRDLLLTGVSAARYWQASGTGMGHGFQLYDGRPASRAYHIGIGMVEKKLEALPGFPPRLRLLVEHLILSHHGQYEFGSPKLP